MDEKYYELLERIATKLGTTAEHLWGVMVKQAPISGITDLISIVVLIAAAFLWCKTVHRKTKTPPIASSFFNPEYWALMRLLGRH